MATSNLFRRLVFIFALCFSLLAFASKAKAQNIEELKAQDGKSVSITGVYRSVSRPIKGKPAKLPNEYATIEISDKTKIYLEPLDSARAVRSEKERKSFEGKKVLVTGVFHKVMPNAGQGIIAPCLTEISEITLAK